MSTVKQQPREGDLMVWHIPQVPGKPFEVRVSSPAEGKRILSALADYDLFQYENHVKPDYANAQGLQVFEAGEWCEWQDQDGNDIGDLDFVNGVLKPN